MNKILRISLTARLRVIADELATDITDEDIDSWADLLEVPIDVALKVACVEGMEAARDECLEGGGPRLQGHTYAAKIDEIIKAENDGLDA